MVDGRQPVHQAGGVLTWSGEDLSLYLIFGIWGDILNRFGSHGSIWVLLVLCKGLGLSEEVSN